MVFFHLYFETDVTGKRHIHDALYRGAEVQQGCIGREHTVQSQSTSQAVLQPHWAWPLPFLSKNHCSIAGKIEIFFFFRLGQIKTVPFPFECKYLTLLPKAGKYFCTLLQSCQDGREGILLLWFDSMHCVPGVGKKGCWRSEATN